MRMMAFLCWFGLSVSVCLFAWGVVGVYGCGLLVSMAVGCWFLWGVIMLTGCLIVVSTWVSDGRGHGSPTRQSYVMSQRTCSCFQFEED